MNKIFVMDDVLANKIAAGEIIERPLSVVKELVENAIDSEASEIEVDLKNSGFLEINVSDNGSGMTKEDLSLCTKRHATSKLLNEKDLFKISTLGFRGEALASMFVVSKFEIKTSTDGEVGYHLKKDNDEDFTISKIGFNRGTKVSVNNLFYNTPVRFKHLSNQHYELSLVTNFINKIALSKPNIAFILKNDDKVLLKTKGNNDILEIIFEIYGSEVTREMLFSQVNSEDFSVEMYFTKPTQTRSRKNYISVIINDRIIKNYELENAVINSYKNFLHTNQYPISIIKINADYSLIDVNVHPTKQQVKISMLDDLIALITSSMQNELANSEYIPTPNLSNDPENKSYDDVVLNDAIVSDNTIDLSEIELDISFEEQVKSDAKKIKEKVQTQMDVIPNDVVEWKLPIFDYVGTLQNTYLLFENSTGMYLIDQHAAQERINYEIIYKKFEEYKFNYQQLIVPLIYTLDSSDFLNIKTKLDEFKKVGIVVAEFGINTIKIEEIDKFYFKLKDLETDILNIINLVIENVDLEFAKLYEEVAETLSCKSSIKANYYINESEINALIKDLNNCEVPYTCPHGRPVFISITLKEIEKMFKRVF